MGNVFSRSWELTKLSFSVLMEDKQLLLIPILSIFFSLVALVAFILPLKALWALMDHSSSSNSGATPWVLLFLLYFVLTFVATFFNVCAVHIIKSRLSGGKEGLSESFSFAFSHIHLIAGWSLVSATVSVIFKFLESLVSNRKGDNIVGMVVGLLVRLLIGGMELTWSIVTLFVVPAMVYKDMGPLDAIAESTRVIKKTWGESLVRTLGMGLMQFFALLAGIIPLAVIGYLVSTTDHAIQAWIGIGAVMLGYILVVMVVFSMAGTVFNTALYAYGSTDKVPQGFPKEILENAFRQKG